jgi:hypothetical protein
MGFFDFIKKDLETKPDHKLVALRTHNYRAEYRELKATILNYLKNKNLNAANINDQFGEILVEHRRFSLIIFVKKGSVLESSIDFKVTYKGFIGANRPYKLISEWYRYLDKQLRLQSIGL